MFTTRVTKRAAGIAAATVLMMSIVTAAAGGIVPSPFGGSKDNGATAWRHDGAAVSMAGEPGAAPLVASDAPVPGGSSLATPTVIQRATAACAGRDDDESTQSVLDLAAPAAAVGMTEDEFCALVAAAGSDTGSDG